LSQVLLREFRGKTLRAAMIILGVDPGTTATGYGVIFKDGQKSSHLASGAIRAKSSLSISKRIWSIYLELESVIKEHTPATMVVESLFHFKNSQSLMKLSQVRGAILLLGETYGMEIHEYAPMEIKRGLTGYGKADKTQVRFMVEKILGLKDLRSYDQADALAMAIFHSHMVRPLRKTS
jgi:crossover junction endodeoxyribonuclease RuvC